VGESGGWKIRFYGLKQATGAWHRKLRVVQKDLDDDLSKSDTCPQIISSWALYLCMGPRPS
jgi:hypothetical protein